MQGRAGHERKGAIRGGGHRSSRYRGWGQDDHTRQSLAIVGPGERMDELAEKVRLTSQRQSERAWGVWLGLVGSVPGQTALELPCPGPVSGLLQVPICAIPPPGCVSF